jgi:hypothetical protein
MEFLKYGAMKKKKNFVCIRGAGGDNKKYVIDLSLFQEAAKQYPFLTEDIISQITNYLVNTERPLYSTLSDFLYGQALTEDGIYHCDMQFDITSVYSKKTWKQEYLYYKLVGIRGYEMTNAYYYCDQKAVNTFAFGTIPKDLAYPLYEGYIEED